MDHGSAFDTSEIRVVGQDSNPDGPANPVRSADLTDESEAVDSRQPAESQPAFPDLFQLEELADPLAQDYFGVAALAFGTTSTNTGDTAVSAVDAGGGAPISSTVPHKMMALPYEEFTAVWNDLADREAAKAYRAVWTLAASSKLAVGFLSKHLAPAVAPASEHLARLIAHLDDRRFSVRQKATQELEQLAELAEPALRRALRNKPSLEMRKRLERLVDKLNDWSGERLRALRAITVLENIGTAEARQILELLAQGTPRLD